MKKIIETYKNHKTEIEKYIYSIMLKSKDDYINYTTELLKKNSFIEIIYQVDKEFTQISPIISLKETISKNIGVDKSHYFNRLKLDKNNIFISPPYIHYKTGKSTISVVLFYDNKYNVMDIDLVLILEELKLIEYNSIYEKVKKIIYATGSIFLSIVSLMLIIYGGYAFTTILFGIENTNFLQEIFKSIISITLGLAIFDLAKQIFEHEVLFHSFQFKEDKQYKVLGKFLISIIIALSIETLMVVFKIALSDYKEMLSAFYLIIGTTTMIVGLAYFYKIFDNSKDKEI